MFGMIREAITTATKTQPGGSKDEEGKGIKNLTRIKMKNPGRRLIR